MDSLVFAAVLFAAAAHAGWNATIKRGLDPLLTTVLIAVGAGVVALPMLPFVGLPAAPAHPWVVASVLIHLAYFAGLIEAYRTGDMSQVYPIARGTAPLLTAIADTFASLSHREHVHAPGYVRMLPVVTIPRQRATGELDPSGPYGIARRRPPWNGRQKPASVGERCRAVRDEVPGHGGYRP